MDSKDFRGSVYGLGFCSLSILLIADAPLLLVPALLMAVIPTAVGIIRTFCSLSTVDNPGTVAADGFGLIVSDLKLGQPTYGIDEKAVEKGLRKISQLTPINFDFEEQESKWWVKGSEIIKDSWVIIGSKRSGKSLTMRWMARETVSAGADIYWCDSHYNPSHEQHIDVLPGVPHEQYVMSTKQRILKTLREVVARGHSRIESGSGANKPTILFWDELQNITSTASKDKFSFEEQEEIMDSIRTIQDEFGKVNIQVVISIKSAKKGQNGLDMSTLLQFNWVMTGKNGKNFSAFDRTAILPDELSEDRKALIDKAKGLLDPKEGIQGAVCLIDGEAEVKAHPDCATLVNFLKEDLGFEVEGAGLTIEGRDEVTAFFHPFMMQIEAAIAKGDSKSSIFTSLPGRGEKSKNNPKWVRFGEIYETTKQRLIEQEVIS